MKEEDRPKPPIPGIIYGEAAYWIIIVGTVIAVVGLALYLVAPSDDVIVEKGCFLENLWAGCESETGTAVGCDASTIWERCSGRDMPHGHWYVDYLGNGDGLAMAGIAIGCLAAVVGMWGAFIGMIRRKEVVYIILSLVIAIILTASAAGLLSIH
ncbi:MAG: DUF1634 domain-containing protein [Archaeoglobaceae archaeon]